ncbi:MAG: universal stress protein [Saprospiraceae bacterium]|nr:universal stress protein [Saprospiraceae bacterium]
MKTILVPTDFSKCATNAYRYALEIAARTGAEIVALHVVYPNEGVENNVYSAFWIDEYFKQRERDLRNWTRRQAKREDLKKVPVRSQCTIGFPASSVSAAVEQEKADMVVMGTTGATGLRGVFLGSVASGVIARTKIPVLAVPQKGAFQEKSTVVFATDMRLRLDEKTIRLMRELPQMKQGKMHIVHVLDKPGEPDKGQEAAISQKLADIQHDFRYLHDRDVAQAIVNFVESTNADLLVAVAHEHSLMHRLFFDSMTRKLAQRVKVPMLALHDKS